MIVSKNRYLAGGTVGYVFTYTPTITLRKPNTRFIDNHGRRWKHRMVM